MTNDENEFDVFLATSVCLTGFSKSDLQSTGMATYFYDFLLKQYAETNDAGTVTSFLAFTEKIMKTHNGDSDAAAKAIALQSLPYTKFTALINELVTMWYMGQWNGEIIREEAYTQGLVWKAADVHAPGAKQPGFASWGRKPLNVK